MNMNKPHALLINPPIYDFSAYNLWMKPIGLLRIAARLRKQGHEISYFDFLNCKERKDKYGCGKYIKKMVDKPESIKDVERPYYRYGRSREEFIVYLKKLKKPDAIFVSSGMTYWYLGVKEVVDLIRHVWEKVPITVGGVYATLCPSHAKENIGANTILSNRESMKRYGINGNYPAWDLIDDKDALVIQTSYGCPYDCSYCGSKKLCKEFIQRDVNEVVDEIDYYVKQFSVLDIAFYDDALLVDAVNHIEPILNKIIENNINVRFHTPNGVHARFIDKELAMLLKRAGFVTIRLGLETSGKSRRDNKVTNEELLTAVKYLKEAGFNKDNISVYTMFGSLNDNIEDVKRDIEFVTKEARVPIKISSYSLVPGSDDYKNWNLPDDLDPLWHNNTIFPLISGRYTLDTIRDLRLFAAASNKQIIA